MDVLFSLNLTEVYKCIILYSEIKNSNFHFFYRCNFALGAGGNVKAFGENEFNETTRNVIEPMASDGFVLSLTNLMML